MHENIDEQISQFLDDELNASESMNLMQQILLDTRLKNKLLRYEAIGHALKTETFIAPRADFLDSIHQQIEREPTYLLPPRNKQAKFKPQHKMLALVASAALVAVILPKQITTISGSQMKASSGINLAQQQTSRRSENIIKQLPHSEIPLNAQINEYLQAHNKNATDNAAPQAPVAKVSR